MTRQLICTVGTSVLTNRDDRPWGGWNQRQGGAMPSAEAVDGWLQKTDMASASAETNTLMRLDLSGTDIIVLLHSDTPEGRFCADRLKTLYSQRVREVHLEKIGRLGYGAAHFTAGLKALVDAAIQRVHHARQRCVETVFCATGGFKAEIAFLNLMGALLGIEVVYIHEQHRELVRLPRLPLTWDAEFVVQHDDFFRWIDEEPRTGAEVESWLKGRPELRPLVEESGDGYAYLSAAGDLLYKVAREKLSLGPVAKWPQAAPLPPDAKNDLSGVEHHRSRGWKDLVKSICEIDCVTRVRFDERAYGGDRVKLIDPERGVIGVRYGDAGTELPLGIETTARGEAQTRLVADYIGKPK